MNKKKFKIFLATLMIVFMSLIGSELRAQKLDAADFLENATRDSAALILDVRTEKEYNEGHIANSLNIDWKSTEFEETVNTKIPKNSTLYVYCLSGGRSAAAAEFLRKKGYPVYELSGGMLKWRSSNMPVEKENSDPPPKEEISPSDFSTLISSNEKVLVDFYAEWCGPCKMMEPFIKEIATSHAGKLKVLRVDVDKNEMLSKSLRVNAVPVLQFYENGKLKWVHVGYMRKKELLKRIRQ